MATPRRTSRLNSLLREVLSEVISREVKNPQLDGKLITVTSVDISRDLRHAKVFVSVIGDDADKDIVMKTLEQASGFISVQAAQKVVMHHFPALVFHLDESVDKQMHIHQLLKSVNDEKDSRQSLQNGSEQDDTDKS
ncbi:Ribosome-binding factor A [Chlamydiales bacterium SCGC AG-110-M15]|nr:Ribosome-binding factor A [Chlamydiales bacterium SCGC AG-110-M15]